MRDLRPLLLVALLLAGCRHATEKDPAEAEKKPERPTIEAAVLKVEPSVWPEVVKTQGSLIADEVTIVGAKVGGRVAEVHVDLGDVVAANAPLATLEQAEFKLEVALAEAQRTQARAALGLEPDDPVEQLHPERAPPVREAKAVWEETKIRVDRSRTLAASNRVTQNELDQAIADEGVAAARHSAAINGVREKIALIGVREAELSVARQRLADTLVSAPFAGLVQQRHVARGSYLQVGQPVVTLVRASTLRFRGTVPERHAYRLALGQQVTLRIESVPEPRVAKITRISPGVEEANRSLTFEVEVPNGNGALRAGMFAEAEIVLDRTAQAIVIPHGAISEFAGVEKVWKLVEGVARETPIQTARRGENGVEVAKGIVAGDMILANAAAGKVARVEPSSTSTTATALAAGRSTEALETRPGGISTPPGAPSE